jgi:hypothetical protein
MQKIAIKTIYYGGFDPGSGEGSLILTPTMVENGKIVDRQEPLRLTIPSLLGGANFSKFVNDRSPKTTATLASVMRDGEMALRYATAEYFVGKLAEEEGINTTSAKGAQKRYTDLHSRLLFLAMYGALVNDADSDVRLVTGVPMSLYSTEIRNAVKQNLQGDHFFGWNGSERTVHVRVGTVTREGIKALALYGDSKTDQGVIDIGVRTTDIGRTTGQTPINKLCKAESYGVGKVHDAIIAGIKTAYRRDVKPSLAQDILKAYTAGRALPPVKVGMNPIPEHEIVSIIEQARSTEWRAIETFIDATWNVDGADVGADIERLLCIGGGSAVWQKELKAKFPQALFPVVSSLFPQEEGVAGLIANAEAYHALAFDIQEVDPAIWG